MIPRDLELRDFEATIKALLGHMLHFLDGLVQTNVILGLFELRTLPRLVFGRHDLQGLPKTHPVNAQMV